MDREYPAAVVVLDLALLAACKARETFPVATGSVEPGTSIAWNGENAPLFASAQLRMGAPLPAAKVVDSRMQDETLAASGRVLLISSLPSLDTPVCNLQTHKLGKAAELDPTVERITISADLPYAQRRFTEDAKLSGIRYLSDYRYGEFGRATGLQIQRNGLLARALIVVDARGIVRYLQVVPEITQLPDLPAAIAAANRLAREPRS